MRYLYTLLLGFSVTLATSSSIAQNFTSRGKDFWVGYQANDGSFATMVIYMTSGNATTHVQVSAFGDVRAYVIPPNTTVVSTPIAKTGAYDARLVSWGLYPKKSIRITSDLPITAYAHLYSNASSGATMLLPVPVLGSENHILTTRQNYT